MPRRFLALWLPHLATDRRLKINPDLKGKPFVLSAMEKGRMMVKAASLEAIQEGITPGKVLADARALLPALIVLQEEPETLAAVLEALAEWCLRFSPIAAVDGTDGIMLDISGCPHLWGGEAPYLNTIVSRMATGGYQAKAAIADTIGAAWAMARFSTGTSIVAMGMQNEALAALPPEALRVAHVTLQRMQRLGFRTIGQFMNMPKATLRRRFGDILIQRLDQALGAHPEVLKPVCPIEPYLERLVCLEPISTATGIEIALRYVLEKLCKRLAQEGNGMRTAVFKGYRIDGNVQQISIGTSRASSSEPHLFRLFALKLATIAPALGIELFSMEAPLVEDIGDTQDTLWDAKGDQHKVAELLDHIAGKVGMDSIRRYLPAAQHWPERSVKRTNSLERMPATDWPLDKLRPLHLLDQPEPIDVMVPLPDYPPILFTHKGKIFKLTKADGPERIEQEWWMADGQPRDYYRVEDEHGARYWLFRSGHYADGAVQWFLHGFFA